MKFLYRLLCVSMLVVIVALYALHRRQQRRRLPPGPPAWPIIGSLHHLFTRTPHRSLAKLSEKYGPFMYMKLGSMPTVVVSNPETAKLFLQTHEKVFASRPHFESADRLTYGQDLGIVAVRYGKVWREIRKLVTVQLFTAKRVNQYMPIMVEEIERLIEEIRGYAKRGEAYNITAGLGELLQSIVCRIMLGKRLWEVCDVKEGYNLKEVVAEGIALFAEPVIGDMIPGLGFLDGKAKRKMDTWHASFDVLLESVLDAREKEGAPAIPDFLQLLLSADLSRERVKSITLICSCGIIPYVCVELLCAGIDTSSVTLDWAMAELLQSTEVMKKAKDEVERVMESSSSKMVQAENIPQLEYLKAIVKETFRLHPPAPLLMAHMSTTACQVGNYILPQGTRLFINAWAIGRDSKTWDCPNSFFPDRFLGRCKQVDVRGQTFELLPFGVGRRSCPGAPLALPIIEMALANLLYSFTWSTPPPPHHHIDMSEKFGAVASRIADLFALPTLRSL